MGGLGQRTLLPVLVMASALLLVAMTLLTALSISLLGVRVAPALEENARVVGASAADRIERAVTLGVPFEAMVGVEPFLEDSRKRSEGVAGLAIVDRSGRLLYAAGIDAAGLEAALAAREGRGGPEPTALGLVANELGALAETFGLYEPETARTARLISLPLDGPEGRLGTLHVAVDPLFIARQLRPTAIDLLLVVGVALLLAFEALALVTSATMGGPLAQFSRVTGRILARDFKFEVVEAGPPVFSRTLAAANARVAAINTRQRRLRERLATFADEETGTLRREALARIEERLDGIGRFAPEALTRRLAATQLTGVRGAAFLFVLAEELARPFLPIYFLEVTADQTGLDQALLVAIPISVFMLVTAPIGPFAAGWSDRVGRRTSFIVGALISTAGLVGTAFAAGFYDLILWRALSGLGYALTFVACQGHVLDRTTEANRARGMSVFVGGILSADICGPAIGGILAEQIGYSATILVSAGVAAFAAALAIFLMDNRHRRRSTGVGLFTNARVIGRCFGNLRFAAILFLAAIPAKMLLTGFLFYLAPLILYDLGASNAEIGRLAMIYGISALVLMPVFARLTDRFEAHGLMVGLGGLIAGWGLVPLLFGGDTGLVALAILALGVGQALSIPAQTAMITIVGRAEIAEFGPGPVLGTFRLAERLGAAAGPLVAAQIAAVFGMAEAVPIFGLAAVTTATLFAALFMTIGTEPQDDDLDLGPMEREPAA